MAHVIYNKKTTVILQARARSVGCYITSYKTESAAKAALTRLDKKGLLGVAPNLTGDFNAVRTPYVKSDFAIADAVEFRANIEKTVTRKNLMSGQDYEETVNTPACISPSSETYWSM